MAILCVEGNVPPSDFLGEQMDYVDAVRLAGVVQEMRTRELEGQGKVIEESMKSLMGSQNEIIKGIGNLTRMMAKIFSK